MARLQFNVPFFRPATDARLSELPATRHSVDERADREPWQESGAGGWHESSLDLRSGVSVSEWSSLDEIDDFQSLA